MHTIAEMNSNVNAKLICFRVKNVLLDFLSNYIMISILLLVTFITVVSDSIFYLRAAVRANPVTLT